MKQTAKNIIWHLVISNRITKFVSKLLGMTTTCNFKNGDIVCLIMDKTKRFTVESNVIMKGKIQLSYFNCCKECISFVLMEPKYLMIAPEQQ